MCYVYVVVMVFPYVSPSVYFHTRFQQDVSFNVTPYSPRFNGDVLDLVVEEL